MQKVRVQSNTSEQELFSLREQNFILEENISELQQNSSELSTKNQTLVLELTNKIKETEAQRTELEELEMRCTTYFNHLQVPLISLFFIFKGESEGALIEEEVLPEKKLLLEGKKFRELFPSKVVIKRGNIQDG